MGIITIIKIFEFKQLERFRQYIHYPFCSALSSPACQPESNFTACYLSEPLAEDKF